MRWFEIASGLRLPVSCEEEEILDQAENSLKKDEMDERTEELARQMVSRGVLNHFVKDGKVHYKPNSAKDIWRER